MPRKKKKKVHYADGELVEEVQIPVQLENANKTIDTILNKPIMSDYEYSDAQEYHKWLDSETDVEIQKECIKRHIFPKDNRDWNINKLVDIFNQKINAAEAQKERPKILTQKLTAEQKRVLAQGSNKIR